MPDTTFRQSSSLMTMPRSAEPSSGYCAASATGWRHSPSPTEFLSRLAPRRAGLPAARHADARAPRARGAAARRRDWIRDADHLRQRRGRRRELRGRMRGGAADILLKPFQEEELLAAVEPGAGQGRPAPAGAGAQTDLRDPLASLTPRELEVFRLVAKGMLNKQIAVVLGTKEGTVKMHRGHVMRKLQLGSVAELVNFADRLSLDDPCPGCTRARRPVPESRPPDHRPSRRPGGRTRQHSTKVHCTRRRNVDPKLRLDGTCIRHAYRLGSCSGERMRAHGRNTPQPPGGAVLGVATRGGDRGRSLVPPGAQPALTLRGFRMRRVRLGRGVPAQQGSLEPPTASCSTSTWAG